MSGHGHGVSTVATANTVPGWRDRIPTVPAVPEAGEIAWDAFVAASLGGDIVQTSAWGAAKRALGLEVHRVVVRNGQEIVGGGQIVVKRFGWLAGIGYIARGPLIAADRRVQASAVLDEIERTARAGRIHQLIVQPPEGGEHLTAELLDRGYMPDGPEVAPSATMRIDLTQSYEDILARMSGSKRNQVRRSQREGIEIRLGGPDDLQLFDRLHQATARRQGFAPRSRSYLRHHWEALYAEGRVQLIFACHRGHELAGIWLTAFGETVTHRFSGSNLDGSKLQPNVGCRWGAIGWAKEQGYRWYDFGGIERRMAELMLAGEALPEAFHRTPAAMKREFGAEPVLLPTSSQYTFSPLARPIVRAAYPTLARTKVLHRLIHAARNG